MAKARPREPSRCRRWYRRPRSSHPLQRRPLAWPAAPCPDRVSTGHRPRSGWWRRLPPAEAVEDMVDAATRLAGGDPEQIPLLGPQLRQSPRGARERAAPHGRDRRAAPGTLADRCPPPLDLLLGRCPAQQRRMAGTSDSPTPPSMKARCRKRRPHAGPRFRTSAAWMMCWLSTRVPSTSKMTSFIALHSSGASTIGS